VQAQLCHQLLLNADQVLPPRARAHTRTRVAGPRLLKRAVHPATHCAAGGATGGPPSAVGCKGEQAHAGHAGGCPARFPHNFDAER
jgi:hypothetical protein